MKPEHKYYRDPVHTAPAFFYGYPSFLATTNGKKSSIYSKNSCISWLVVSAMRLKSLVWRTTLICQTGVESSLWDPTPIVRGGKREQE